MDGFHAAGDGFLRALPDRLQAPRDFLGYRCGRVHGARGRCRSLAGIGIHLREDLVHLREPRLMTLGRLRDGVGGKERGKHLPAVAQLLDPAHQDLHHGDAGFTHELELLREPRADLPSREKGTQHRKGGPKHANACHRVRHGEIHARPRGRGPIGGSHRCGTRRLPGGDERGDQSVDQDRKPGLGDAL